VLPALSSTLPCWDTQSELLPLPNQGVRSRYFAARASKPKDRVALALAVNVGSMAEEDSEQGIAHILEHLAFNATEVRSFRVDASGVSRAAGGGRVRKGDDTGALSVKICELDHELYVFTHLVVRTV
jgi:hypothetical protein